MVQTVQEVLSPKIRNKTRMLALTTSTQLYKRFYKGNQARKINKRPPD